MAKFVIRGNHIFMRRWFRWYKLIGKHAHPLIFHGLREYEPKDNNSNKKRDEIDR